MGTAAVIISNDETRERVLRWVRGAKSGTHVTFVGPGKRTLPQNARLHAMCTDVATQVEWPIGSGQRRDMEAWKDIFTAALRSANNGLDVVPGINGGFVLLGMHTSAMTAEEMGDLMELISAWGAENGVVFSEPVS